MALTGLHQANGLAAANNAVTARGLRLIEPLVRNFEKRVVTGRVARATGDADAHRHTRVLLTRGATGDTASHALAERQCVLGIDAVRNDNEFLAAEAVGEIRHTCGGHNVERDALEHLVAGGMTETIVEGFEMIDVNQHESQRPACRGGVLDGATAMRFQRMAIESTGERVATGTRQQILIALAIGKRIEHVPDARHSRTTPDGPLEINEVNARKNGVERDRRHFGKTATDLDVETGASEHV